MDPEESSFWSNIQASESSRQHNGNVYGNVYHNNSAAETPEQRFQRMQSWLGGIRDQFLRYENIGIPRGRDRPAGEWLLRNETFTRWQTMPNSWMWLYGIPGCGKTVLNAKAVRYLREQRVPQEEAVVHFYFDFQSRQNSLVDMLRSLVLQLTDQRDETPPPIIDLFEMKCAEGKRQPSMDQLLNVLHGSFEMFSKVFIVLDALDESESEESRELEAVLEAMHEWDLPCAHFLVTSRVGGDVFAALEQNVSKEYRMEVIQEEVDGDIQAWVADQLSSRGRLGRKISRWNRPELFKFRIETALMERASGMYATFGNFETPVNRLHFPRFLLTKLQLEELERCRNEHDVDQALRNMPNTLTEMYDRILGKISGPNQQQYARDILTWISFARRPLSVREIEWSIAFSVNAQCEMTVDPRKRMQHGATEIFEICQSLVGIVGNAMQTSGQAENDETVRLAHSTVKEHLMSAGRAKESMPWLATLEARPSHRLIAESLLAYLFHLSNFDWNREKQPARETREFSLAWYAIYTWPEHADLGDAIRCPYDDNDPVHRQMCKLVSDNAALTALVRIFEPRMSTGRLELQKALQDLKIVWYHASRMTLRPIKIPAPRIRSEPRETRHWAVRMTDQRIVSKLVPSSQVDAFARETGLAHLISIHPQQNNALRQTLLFGNGTWEREHFLGLDTVKFDELPERTITRLWHDDDLDVTIVNIESPIWSESQLPTVLHSSTYDSVKEITHTILEEEHIGRRSVSTKKEQTSEIPAFAYSRIR